jgi:5-oxopent-3-ene-1,2,5-tricarboxylate decarboxylase/2-hydroxyhepta-2,4-diene-1,7-dioate isomerase
MNFEFPFDELPAVMRGPRVERRRVLVGGSAFWGTVVEEGVDVGKLRLDDGRLLEAEGLAYLPPVSPSKIIAVHISYSSRSHETRNKPKPTETPTYFTKPPTALNGHRGQILKPADVKYLNYEGEYAVVIGKSCRNVTPDEAWDFIEGFCPALDMGLQDFRDTDQGSMLRVKGADTLLPIGPGLVRGVDLFAQTLRTTVNGLVVQEAQIGDETIWGPHYVIADIARHITLVPGDVILMGTPCHSRSVDAGDVVACEITGIGRVEGTVVAVDAPRASALGVGHAPTDTPEVRRVALGFDERVPERLKENLRRAKGERAAKAGGSAEP